MNWSGFADVLEFTVEAIAWLGDRVARRKDDQSARRRKVERTIDTGAREWHPLFRRSKSGPTDND